MTVKDFIDYNNPCFSCGSKIIFNLSILNHKTNIPTIIYASPEKSGIKFPFKIGYNDNLFILVNTVTNSFAANDFKAFILYVKDKTFTFDSICPKCNSEIFSNPIDFNLINNFIKPISLNLETLLVKSKGTSYRLHSIFKEESSHLSILNKNNSYIEMNIKLFPLYKFKNKETFLKKAKIYLTFS